MNLKEIFGKVMFQLKRKSPQILIYGGMTSMAAGAVVACVETRKNAEIFDDHKKRVSEAKEKGKMAVIKEYVKTGGKVAVKFWPSATMIVGGAGCITGGERKLNGRYLTAVTVAAALKASNDELRARLEKKVGPDEAKKMVNGTEQVTLDDGTVIDDLITDAPLSPYARIFAYGESSCAEPGDDYNESFLYSAQEGFNTLFKARRGALFLNEVYADLGLKKSKAGQLVGWIYDKNNEYGDNYIDLRISRAYRRLPDGELEQVWIIDPNVDGVILDRAAEMDILD